MYNVVLTSATNCRATLSWVVEEKSSVSDEPSGNRNCMRAISLTEVEQRTTTDSQEVVSTGYIHAIMFKCTHQRKLF